MKPITVSTTIPMPREDVFSFLDVLGNHEPFVDHMLADWTVSGPASGVGAKARMRAVAPGPTVWMDMEVVDSRPPERIVERAVSGKGKRQTRGTYTLTDAPGGGTLVNFELAYEKMPAAERLMSPLLSAYLRRGNQKAMDRLRERLAAAPPAAEQPSA
jgi:uncharacterized protein YndB with AHSA1/START domain